MFSIYIFLDALIRMIPCIFLILLIFHNCFRYANKYVYLVAISLTLFSSITPALLYYHYQSFQAWLPCFNIIYLGIILFFCIYFIRLSYCQVLLIIFIILNYSDGMSYIKECVLSSLLYYHPEIPYITGALAMRFICMLLSFPIILLFCIKLLRPILEKGRNQSFHRCLWSIPACFYVIYRIFVYPQEVSQPATILQDSNIILSILWMFMTFLANALILYMLNETLETAELQKQLELSKLSSRSAYKQYEQLLIQIQETKEARHNLRHNLLALKTYCKDKDYEKIEVFINEYLNTLNTEQSLIFCENVLINCILIHYYEIAQEHNISIDISVKIPNILNIHDEDICVIFGNAIENAIEACDRQVSGERYIRIKAAVFGSNSFILQVSNSYNGHIRCNEQQVLMSSKRNEEGIGVVSIHNICSRYQGVCNISHNDKEFSISVFLNELS